MRNKQAAIVAISALAALIAVVQTPTARAQDTFKVLHPFTWAAPGGSLTRDAAGNFYDTAGTPPPWYGAVYKLSQNTDGTWAVSFLYHFDSDVDANGAGPTGGVIFDGKGNLYGVTSEGGGGRISLRGGRCIRVKPRSKRNLDRARASPLSF